MVKSDLGQSCSDISKDSYKPDWPLFPTEHDHLVPEFQIQDRCNKLAEYLERLISYPPFRDNPATLNLVSVSPLTFINGIGPSIIESSLNKRSGDNIYYGHFSNVKICCEKVKMFHVKRWFVMKDTYLVYTDQERNNYVGFAMLVDRAFKAKMCIKAGSYHSIEIKNLQRTLILKCNNKEKQIDWYDSIQKMLNGPARYFYRHELLPNDSFAPERKGQLCTWFVNSSQYMEQVMHGLNNAKEEIFITDWWFSPEIFLKRPTDDLQFRLDKILFKKAKEGVKIYIQLFKEVTMAIDLASSRVKNLLSQNGKNPNIKVLRHPEHNPSGYFNFFNS
jgi:phospholipase D1/2